MLTVRRQLATAEGLVGYSLDANLLRRVFWTFSVWTDDEHLRSFASSDPHRTIIARPAPLMGQTRITTHTMVG